MAYIKNKTIVEIPALASKPPPNPLLGYDGTRTGRASTIRSGSSQASVTQSTIRNRVLLHDQRCFVTGALSTQLEACHLINAIRVKAGNRVRKEPLKEAVVRVPSLLTR